MADRGADDVVQTEGEGQGKGRGWAYEIGWGLFLAFVALTPAVLGALPSKAGWLSQFSAYDPVGLPKLVVFLALCGLSLSALCVSVARGESKVYWHPVLWILVSLIGWGVVSTVFSVSPWLSVWGSYYVYSGLVSLIGYVLVAFLAVQYVRSAGALRTLAATAVVSGALVSVYALMQSFDLDPFQWAGGETSRAFSTFGNADMLGVYLVFPFVLALGLALSSSGTRRSLLWSAAAALVGAALLATATRSAWFGALVGLSCLALIGWRGVRRTSRRRRLVFVIIIVATLAAIAALVLIIRPTFPGRPITLSEGLARLSSGRTVIWLTSLQGWLAHPITGWGPGAFVRAFESAAGAERYASMAVGLTADDAHSLIVQTLVTLGIPGLLLMVWALAQTAIQGFRGLVHTEDREWLLSAAVWAAFVGMITSLALSVSLPDVEVWLWLAAGLLLVPTSHPIPRASKPALAAASALGVALALWAGSWLIADAAVGQAMKRDAGAAQVSELETAVRLNPMSQSYRLLVAEALIDEALAAQHSGQGSLTVDLAMTRAIAAYEDAVAADRGDVLSRLGLAKLLAGFSAVHPQSDAAQRAVTVALEARSLAPYNAEALVALSLAYKAAGRLEDANKTAQLARSVAPDYASQALGSLGPGVAPTP